MENCNNGILKIVEMFRKNYYYIIICNSFYYPLYEKNLSISVGRCWSMLDVYVSMPST